MQYFASLSVYLSCRFVNSRYILNKQRHLFAKTQGVCFVEEKAFSIDFWQDFPYTESNNLSERKANTYGI